MTLASFLPEMILSGLMVWLLCLSLFKQQAPDGFLKILMRAGSAALIAACLATLSQPALLFYSAYQVDSFSQGFKLLIAVAFAFTVFFSEEAVSIPASRRIEYLIFLCSGTLGMMMIPSAADLLMLYVSLELSSYSLYLLAAILPQKRNAEAGVKYLLFGAASSGILLWGLSLVVGLAGTSSLAGISAKIPMMTSEPAFRLALFLMSLSFLFKLSGAPMHFWAPDVYESAPMPVTAFIATASKAAAVAVLIRVFMAAGWPPVFAPIFGVLAFLSMTIGNGVALVQQDVKRLLAYSSIAQAGYLLTGFLAGSFEGYSTSFFYAGAYVLMNAGAFLVLILLARSIGHDNPQIAHFDGLAERSPLLALILLLSLLSLAGIPPLVGFTGKWILFSAAMDKGHWFLVLWGVLNSVVSLFYYLTLVRHAYLEKPKRTEPIRLSFTAKTFCWFVFLALIVLGVFPDRFIAFARQAIAGVGIIPSWPA